MRKKAELVNVHFAKVSKQFYEIDTLELGAVTGFVDQLQAVLDDLWQDPNIAPTYPENRMDRLMKTISTSLGKRIEQEFKKVDVWQSAFSDVRVKLNECMKIAKGWKDRTSELTT